MEASLIVGVLFVAVVFPLFFASPLHKDEEEKARTRRLAEAKLNSRLLRFNL